MPAVRRTYLALLACALLCSVLPSSSRAQSGEEACAALARRVAAALGTSGDVTLAVQNLASLPPAEFGRLRRALEAGLENEGLRVREAAWDAAAVRVALSENLRGFVWVVDTHVEDAREVAFVTFSRLAAVAPAAPEDMLQFERRLIWQQDDPILDFALLPRSPGLPERLIVLGPHTVSLYTAADGSWALAESLRIPHDHVLPRDARGTLQWENDRLRLYFAGTECAGWGESDRAFRCVSPGASARMPFRVNRDRTVDVLPVPDRNDFLALDDASTGVPAAARAFFSAAAVPVEGTSWWVVAGSDGKTRLFGEAGKDPVELPGWGSQVAGLGSKCGSGWQVLATQAGDFTENDTLQAFEIRDGQMVAVSRRVEFFGPVTELRPQPDGRATAVVRNLKTARYEAYTLTLVCNR